MLNLASNPAFMAAIQQKLTSLVGKSSGYVESLPIKVRNRVEALKIIQKEYEEAEREYRKERRAIERKHALRLVPLYSKRRKIVHGEVEPEAVLEEAKEEAEEGMKVGKLLLTTEEVQGIPEFWLSAMKNSKLADAVQDRDEDALTHLVDIQCKMFESEEEQGYELVFEFTENEVFEEKQLTKRYLLKEGSGSSAGEVEASKSVGCDITWKNGDITHRVIKKKQKHRSKRQTRVVTRTEPVDSFFHFFSPPQLPDPEAEEGGDFEEAEMLALEFEQDWAMGEFLKEEFIPKAVLYFTGEALDEEEDDEDEEDELPGLEGGEEGEAPECKQQ